MADGSVVGIHKAAGISDYNNNIAVSIADVCKAIKKSFTLLCCVLKLKLRFKHQRGHV